MTWFEAAGPVTGPFGTDSHSSARASAPRFLQIPPRDDALALRCPSPPSGWGRTFTSRLSNMLGTPKKPPRLVTGAVQVEFGLGYFTFVRYNFTNLGTSLSSMSLASFKSTTAFDFE